MTERRGLFFLVVGPSGVGKDSLIDGARERLAEDDSYHFPKRAITRPEGAGGEDHQAVTTDAFERLEGEGAFMLSWQAHGHRYGVPIDAERALSEGRSVVVNVSREVIPYARAHFSPVRVLLVSAPLDILKARLKERGRETADDIRRRLDRARSYHVAGDDVLPVSNADRLDRAIEQFVGQLEEERRKAFTQP